jgi:putative transposase
VVSIVEDVFGVRCGEAKLTLAERMYDCTTCGLTLDRDLNAARNLAALATTIAADTAED